MISSLAHVGVGSWLAAGYGLVLLAIAYGIDAMARRAARSVEGDERDGFTYHESHDAWLCPEDQWLWPHSFDPDNRVMRYRASPTICNACPVKDTCTFSGSGREIRRNVDPWPASEAARFHRGIACAVVVMGVVWPIATMLAGPPPADMFVLATVTLIVAVGSLPLWSHLRRTPADPMGMVSVSEDDNFAEREEIEQNVIRRRTTYRSDKPHHSVYRSDNLPIRPVARTKDGFFGDTEWGRTQ